MSSHYEERMEADLAEIRGKVSVVSDLVEAQVHDAVQALLTVDRNLASQVVLGDRQVNRRIRQIDHLCHAFIVRHAPSAGHLRYASAVLRLDVALERVGDYAGSIGRMVARLSGPPPGALRRDLELIAQQSRLTLSQALAAFHEGDVEAARRVYGLEEQMDLTLETVFAELLRAAEKEKAALPDIFGLRRIAHLLKRVSEQAINVADQTLFVCTGEEPDEKVFRILFVGERNAAASQIAEAYARKVYPESGRYASAGWAPNSQLDPALVAYMDAQGVDVSGATPSAVAALTDVPEHFHVIVLLSPEAREHLGDVPYRSTVVECVLEADGTDLDVLYKEVVVHVQDLMRTLSGPDAR